MHNFIVVPIDTSPSHRRNLALRSSEGSAGQIIVFDGSVVFLNDRLISGLGKSFLLVGERWAHVKRLLLILGRFATDHTFSHLVDRS